jgi:hypothetical protein
MMTSFLDRFVWKPGEVALVPPGEKPAPVPTVEELQASLLGRSKHNPNHDAHSGRFASGSGAAGGHGAASAPVPEQPRSERALRATAAYRPCNVHEQRYAEAQEQVFANAIGGTHLADNEPMDVTVPRAGGGLHGLEVKTLVNQKNDKITMKKDAVDAKTAWAQKNQGELHTVVLDHRDRYDGGANKEHYSGNEIMYKRGVGAFRLGQMQKCKDAAEVKRLMELPEGELPRAARGPAR